MRILIIGNGTAAISAVEAMREVDRDSEITIVSKEKEPVYSPCFLSGYLSGEIEKNRLYIRDSSFYDENRVETIFGNAATEVRVKDKKIKLSNGKKLPFDRLLIAAGSNPVIPRLEGIQGDGVFSFKTISDADRIMLAAQKADEAVVMGAGFIGLEAAEALSKRGVKVTVIEREDRILPRMLDHEMAEIVKRHIEKNGIRIITGKGVKSIQRKRKQITGVDIDGKTIPCKLLIVAAGVRPNLEMIKNSSIKTDQGILVDEHMRTSIPDIYAAGDIIELEIQGIRKTNPIWFNAVKGGKIAGSDMIGIERRYETHLMDMNVVTLFGLSVLSVGIQSGTEALKVHDSKGIRKVYLNDDGSINGAQLIGDVTRGGVYLSLINRRFPAGKIDLLQSAFNYGSTLKQVSSL
ncbi:MAG: FAD-dependent oxidoreductase [Nitrospirota bacterium]